MGNVRAPLSVAPLSALEVDLEARGVPLPAEAPLGVLDDESPCLRDPALPLPPGEEAQLLFPDSLRNCAGVPALELLPELLAPELLPDSLRRKCDSFGVFFP
jgi:hypothetical protein